MYETYYIKRVYIKKWSFDFVFFNVLYCNHVAFYPSKDIKNVDNFQNIYSGRGQLMRLRDLKFA